MKCDKADTLLVLRDNLFVKPFKGTTCRRVIAEVFHPKEIVQRFDENKADVRVFRQDFVEFEEMIVGWRRVKDDNRVILPHATLYEIFTSILGRLFALPV